MLRDCSDCNIETCCESPSPPPCSWYCHFWHTVSSENMMCCHRCQRQHRRSWSAGKRFCYFLHLVLTEGWWELGASGRAAFFSCQSEWTALRWRPLPPTRVARDLVPAMLLLVPICFMLAGSSAHICRNIGSLGTQLTRARPAHPYRIVLPVRPRVIARVSCSICWA